MLLVTRVLPVVVIVWYAWLLHLILLLLSQFCTLLVCCLAVLYAGSFVKPFGLAGGMFWRRYKLYGRLPLPIYSDRGGDNGEVPGTSS